MFPNPSSPVILPAASLFNPASSVPSIRPTSVAVTSFFTHPRHIPGVFTFTESRLSNASNAGDRSSVTADLTFPGFPVEFAASCNVSTAAGPDFAFVPAG